MAGRWPGRLVLHLLYSLFLQPHLHCVAKASLSFPSCFHEVILHTQMQNVTDMWTHGGWYSYTWTHEGGVLSHMGSWGTVLSYMRSWERVLSHMGSRGWCSPTWAHGRGCTHRLHSSLLCFLACGEPFDCSMMQYFPKGPMQGINCEQELPEV